MHKSKYIFFFFTLVVLLSNCRKYDECKVFSLRSDTKLLTSGIWRIEKYEVNGVDSTDFILNNPNYADIQFKDDGIKGSGNGSYTAGNFGGGYKWTSQSIIHLGGNDSLGVTKNPLFVSNTVYPTVEFQITCLKKKHFSIKVDYDPSNYYKHTYNKNNYYIKFKNVK